MKITVRKTLFEHKRENKLRERNQSSLDVLMMHLNASLEYSFMITRKSTESYFFYYFKEKS
jgi:hypothetical protein